MPARHGVSLAAQIFRQVHFHLGSRLEGHRVQVGEKLRQQFQTVTFHHPRRFQTGLVVREALLRRQASHAHVHAGLGRVPRGIHGPHLAQPSRRRIKQHHIDTVVLAGPGAGAELAERAATHGPRKLPRVLPLENS